MGKKCSLLNLFIYFLVKWKKALGKVQVEKENRYDTLTTGTFSGLGKSHLKYKDLETDFS